MGDQQAKEPTIEEAGQARPESSAGEPAKASASTAVKVRAKPRASASSAAPDRPEPPQPEAPPAAPAPRAVPPAESPVVPAVAAPRAAPSAPSGNTAGISAAGQTGGDVPSPFKEGEASGPQGSPQPAQPARPQAPGVGPYANQQNRGFQPARPVAGPGSPPAPRPLAPGERFQPRPFIARPAPQGQPQGQAPGQGPQQPNGSGRWVDLGSKPQGPRPAGLIQPSRPASTPQVGGPPRPGGFVPRPFIPAGGPVGGPRPLGPRPPFTPRPPSAGFPSAPGAARPDTKDWIRSKTDARRPRGPTAKKKEKPRTDGVTEEGAKRKPVAGGKPVRPLPPKPKPVSLKPRATGVALGARTPALGRLQPQAAADGAAQASEAAGELETGIRLPRVLTVKDLADTLDVNAVEVIKSLMENGIMASINQVIDYDTAEIIATDLGYTVRPASSPVETSVTEASPEAVPQRKRFLEEDKGKLVTRPPVVTIMGHVDHGKTSLLDAIRQTNVIATEAGGITQHIGAYQVDKNDHKITFLDTPGHQAFTAMRARGAQATDVVILVVAADDGVQPQTLEALNHARAAKVPIIVALNKIDKDGANPDRVKQQLSDAGLVVEEWGGDTVLVPVSAKKKIGIDHLLEMILLVADLQDLKANPDRPAVGTIVEAQMDKAKGPLATVLVQHGTLQLGDTILVGEIVGKVKAMFNDKGKRIRKAEPATPAGILGLPEVPLAGDTLEAVADEKTARALASDRIEKRQRAAETGTAKVSLDDLFAQIQAGHVKELNIILKADVQGSLEPIVNSLTRLGDEKVKVKIIHKGIGSIGESDVSLAVASKAIVVGFNQRADPAAKSLAEKEGVDIRFYDVIYNLVDDVEKALKGLYEPKYQDVLEGKAEVRAIFKVGKTGAVAGCFVLEGPITRTSMAKVVRDGKTLFTGKLSGLRRFKDDVKEVEKGYECGITLDGFADFQEKDIIETYTKERVN
jgi:translation initiation factor IF-2